MILFYVHYVHCVLVAPKVEFSLPDGELSPVLHVNEPLSNSSFDQSLLSVMLTRSGDISISSIVTMSAVDQTAKNERDFLFHATNITFPAGNSSMFLTVPILANHMRDMDSTFILQLSTSLDVKSDSDLFSSNDSVEVVIVNRALDGPYFPGLPQLDNVEDKVRSYSGGQYYDLPLLCITVSISGMRCVCM